MLEVWNYSLHSSSIQNLGVSPNESRLLVDGGGCTEIIAQALLLSSQLRHRVLNLEINLNRKEHELSLTIMISKLSIPWMRLMQVQSRNFKWISGKLDFYQFYKAKDFVNLLLMDRNVDTNTEYLLGQWQLWKWNGHWTSD